MSTAISIKCRACGAESSVEYPACLKCGSGNLVDRRRYLRRALAVSIMVAAVALLVVAMVYGEFHRAAGIVAIGV